MDRDRERDRAGSAKPRGGDEPPNSRLFILCQKGCMENDFRDAFDKYGTIEDVWIIKDRRTNEDRGIVYIKFAKTSDAMRAMEEMNGQSLPGTSKAMKIVVANSKRDGSTRDPREDERLVRLFVIIPKHFTETDLREEFSRYGDLESVTVLKERSSGENKGFGYVRFFKPVHAALAFENCESCFKPKFAEPQRSRDERDEYEHHSHYQPHSYSGAGHKRNYEDDFGYGGGYSNDLLGPGPGRYDRKMTQSQSLLPFPPITSGSNTGLTDLFHEYPNPSKSMRLVVQAPVGLPQGYLYKLFNLIPGLEYCDLNQDTGTAYIRYNSCQCASYAKNRLSGFEYPIGSPLVVQYAEEANRIDGFSGPSSLLGGGYGGGQSSLDSNEIQKKAFMLLEKAGINPNSLMGGGSSGRSLLGGGDGRKERTSYCNVPLPPLQPTIPEDGNNMAQRLFIVCQPSLVSDRILRDAFCRFGNLIDVYLLSGRNYGYAKYGTKESAEKAIEGLHGITLAGQRMKVFEAEPPKSHSSREGDEGPSKKQRL